MSLFNGTDFMFKYFTFSLKGFKNALETQKNQPKETANRRPEYEFQNPPIWLQLG